MEEMTEREQLAALEGWANNPQVPLPERWATAIQVIAGLRKLLEWPEFCPYDCDNCHSDECPCDRLGCAGKPL